MSHIPSAPLPDAQTTTGGQTMTRISVAQPRSRVALTALLVLALSGCASGPKLTVVPVSQHTFAPVSQVQTLTQPPRTPYVVIAKIRAAAPAGTSPAQVIAALLVKAGALGANAVILHDQSRTLPPQIQYSPSGGQYQSLPAQAIPIYEGIAIHLQTPSR